MNFDKVSREMELNDYFIGSMLWRNIALLSKLILFESYLSNFEGKSFFTDSMFVTSIMSYEYNFVSKGYKGLFLA